MIKAIKAASSATADVVEHTGRALSSSVSELEPTCVNLAKTLTEVSRYSLISSRRMILDEIREVKEQGYSEEELAYLLAGISN